MRLSLILFSLFLIFQSCNQSNLSEKEPEIGLKDTLDIFNKAFADGDSDVLEGLLTEDYLHCNSGNPPVGKADWLKYIESRKAKIESGELIQEDYGMVDFKAVLYNKNTAVINGLVFSKGINAGQKFDNRFRVTHTWILENGIWKRAAFHDTKL